MHCSYLNSPVKQPSISEHTALLLVISRKFFVVRYSDSRGVPAAQGECGNNHNRCKRCNTLTVLSSSVIPIRNAGQACRQVYGQSFLSCSAQILSERVDPVRPSLRILDKAWLVRCAIAGIASFKVCVHLLCESRGWLHAP